jgi:AraC-like DNA-binding protein
MTAIPLTRAAGLRPVADYLRRVGAPVERLLARVHLPVCVLDEPEALVPTRQACRFMEDSARAAGIENLGLMVGRETPIEGLGVFGDQIRRSRTLEEAIETVLRRTSVFSSGEQRWLVEAGDRLYLCQRFADGLGEHQQADQFVLMITINLLRLAAGRGWRPPEVHLPMPRPTGSHGLRSVSGTVRFGQRAMAVAFPRALLGRSFPPATGMRAVEPREVDAWMASAPAADFPGSLLQVADALSPSGYPQIRSTASAMGMSVRSVQRRLAEAGVTYKELVAHQRFAAAMELLGDGSAKILDIALDLGYSDHAHFTRAFRRWAGTAPREFRRVARDLPVPPVRMRAKAPDHLRA